MIGKKALFEFFKLSPTPSLVLLPDAPKFTIAEVNTAYLDATLSSYQDLIGKGIFEAFPDDTSDATADGVANLSQSLHTVLSTKKPDKMPLQKYDIPERGTSNFIVKYWKPENIPMCNEDGELRYIIHTVTDVTENMLATIKIDEATLAIAKGLEIIEQTEAISNLGRWELDLINNVLLWSDSNYMMLGFKPQEFEITFDKTYQMIHPEDQERVLSHFETTVKNLADYRIELRFIKKDKSVINVISKGKYIFDLHGNPIKLVGVMQDITEIKQAEEAAKKTQQELQKVLDLSLDIICTIDGQGRFLKINPASIAIWGYAPEEMIGRHYSEFVLAADLEKSKKVTGEVVSGIDLTNFENTYITKDGTLVPMMWSARWQSDEQLMYCVGKDITTTKKAEVQALERQVFIETALFNLPIGISVNRIDNGKAVWMNTKFTEIYGWPKKTLKDIRTFFENVYPDAAYRSKIMTKIMNDIESGDEDRMQWNEITITTKNKGQRIVNAKNIPVYDQNLMISTVMDVTEQIKAKKLLEESHERFEYVTKATFDAIWDWDLSRDTIYWGDGFETIFDYNLAKLKSDSSSWITNIHPDDIDRISNSFYHIIKSNKTNWVEEYRFKKNNGSYARVINKGIIVRDILTGRALRIIGAMQDVTKKKEEEERLKLLETVVTNTKEAILITEAEPLDDPGPKIIYVNEAFTRMTGYTASEVIGKSPRILQGPNTDQAELKKLSIALRNWESCEVTVLNYKKNGEEFWINMSITPVADTTGWYTHWVSIERDVTQQKQEEERLKLLETVITNTNDAVVIKEAVPSSVLGRKIAYVNKSFTRMSGYSSEEIIGQTHKLLQGPNTNKEELDRFYDALDNWKPIEITIINYTKEGKEYWVQLSLNPVSNDKGEYTHWISIERDVTEKKVVEAELLKRLKEISDYKYAIDESSIVAITNQKGVITYVNQNFCAISKYTSEELLGQDHRILNSGYHPKEYIKNLWTTIAKGNVWKGEIKNLAKDGLPYWVDTTIVPFLNEAGKPYQYVAIRSDITERKIQEQILYETTQTLLDTLQSIQDGFYTLDSEWNVSYWNKTAEKMSGKTREEMIGKNFWQLYDGKISEKIHAAFYKAKSLNKPVRIEVYSKLTDNWFDLSAFPSEKGLTVYFKNISERKQTESTLRKSKRSLEHKIKELALSNQELEQFAYVASHDLQEPLRMVTSFLTQIESKYESLLDDKGKKYIFFAVDGAKRMRQIILDLLEFSRVGKSSSKPEEVDLNDIVEDITKLYRKQITDKKAQVLYETLPKIRTHATPLKQVLQNLISNSLKYAASDRPPLIRIACKLSNNVWKFEITDNGIGISAEYYDKIFIIFQRLHSKDEYTGTGMGLAITKKIIDNLGGQIWVTSTEGQGTTFYFTIPKK